MLLCNAHNGTNFNSDTAIICDISEDIIACES